MFNPSINLLGRRNIKISKCELDINFKESDELMLVSKYPISKDEALKYNAKDINITNNSTCDTAYYKLTIKDLVNSSINKDMIYYQIIDKKNTMTYKLGDFTNDGAIDNEDVRALNWYLKDDGSANLLFVKNFSIDNFSFIRGDVNGDKKITDEDLEILNQYKNNSITTFPAGNPGEEKSTNQEKFDVNPDNFIINDSLKKGETHEYEIKMWIDVNATNTDLYENGDTTKPIEYKFALNLEAYETNSTVDANEFAKANVGKNGLEKVTHEIDDTLQVDNRFATEYRYRGGNVNNYVLFNNEMWRIIGIIPTEDIDGNVENRFKIIKSNHGNQTSQAWDNYADAHRYTVDWTKATMNDYLNTAYYNNLTSDAKNMVGTTKYYLGGISAASELNSTTIDNEMWQYERKKENDSSCVLDSSVEFKQYKSGLCYFFEDSQIMQNDANKKIALMSISDFGYGAPKECTKNIINEVDNNLCPKYDNWLSNDSNYLEVLLSAIITDVPRVFSITDNEITSQDSANPATVFRPTLTLSSNVKISGGSGTSSDPYTLSLE